MESQNTQPAMPDDRTILDLFDPIVCYGAIEQTRAAVALRGG
jgi:hypothetical protein